MSNSTPRILVTGASGFIGSHYLSLHNASPTPVHFLTPSHQDLDITNRNAVLQFFAREKPDCVVHFAAHRDATSAELQRNNLQQSAWQTNVVGTQHIAQASERHHAHFICISSDFVFSGLPSNKGPYTESDLVESDDNLLSWYGITKREAEKAVHTISTPTTIIRINNVTIPGNQPILDYIGKIVALSKANTLYPMFDDQVITLTYIPTLYLAIDKIISEHRTGIFHVASADTCTPFELAAHIFHKLNLPSSPHPMSITAFLAQFPRRYPQFGGLRTAETEHKLRITMPGWKDIVHRYLESLR
jgi:dTDP-4-dehydrorhamnose reductase